MRVSIVDIDNKYRDPKSRGKIFPNRAAMVTSGYWKSKGATVGFDLDTPDIVYIFCVFSKNKMHAVRESAMLASYEPIVGGSGISFDNELPYDIEKAFPDYSLYDMKKTKIGYSSIGFTTRGCFRKECEGFCIVRKKEGPLRTNQHISEFHHEPFKKCTLLDNNILGITDWFFENTRWATERKIYLDITQGMDIRLMTDEIAQHLKKTKFVDQQIKFAWDFIEDEEKVLAGIQMLKDAGINTRRNVSFYVLCGYNSTLEEDIHRVQTLKENKCHGFVMKYHDKNAALNHLARWSDKRELFWKTSLYEYKDGVIIS